MDNLHSVFRKFWRKMGLCVNNQSCMSCIDVKRNKEINMALVTELTKFCFLLVKSKATEQK